MSEKAALGYSNKPSRLRQSWVDIYRQKDNLSDVSDPSDEERAIDEKIIENVDRSIDLQKWQDAELMKIWDEQWYLDHKRKLLL